MLGFEDGSMIFSIFVALSLYDPKSGYLFFLMGEVMARRLV
jgi:hypothetical protein